MGVAWGADERSPPLAGLAFILRAFARHGGARADRVGDRSGAFDSGPRPSCATSGWCFRAKKLGTVHSFDLEIRFRANRDPGERGRAESEQEEPRSLGPDLGEAQHILCWLGPLSAPSGAVLVIVAREHNGDRSALRRIGPRVTSKRQRNMRQEREREPSQLVLPVRARMR
jgi:hypothetical protein